MNKGVVMFILALIIIILLSICLKVYIDFSNYQKEKCINKGGNAVESYLGFYEKCIYGGKINE